MANLPTKSVMVSEFEVQAIITFHKTDKGMRTLKYSTKKHMNFLIEKSQEKIDHWSAVLATLLDSDQEIVILDVTLGETLACLEAWSLEIATTGQISALTNAAGWQAIRSSFDKKTS